MRPVATTVDSCAEKLSPMPPTVPAPDGSEIACVDTAEWSPPTVVAIGTTAAAVDFAATAASAASGADADADAGASEDVSAATAGRSDHAVMRQAMHDAKAVARRKRRIMGGLLVGAGLLLPRPVGLGDQDLDAGDEVEPDLGIIGRIQLEPVAAAERRIGKFCARDAVDVRVVRRTVPVEHLQRQLVRQRLAVFDDTDGEFVGAPLLVEVRHPRRPVLLQVETDDGVADAGVGRI